MRGGRALIGILTVGLLLALVFYQVDVPSINPHEGAVAYTQPTVKSTYIASASTSQIAFAAPPTLPHRLRGLQRNRALRSARSR